jgi:hypothetical protein
MHTISKGTFLAILLGLSNSLWANGPEPPLNCWWKLIDQTPSYDKGITTTLALNLPTDLPANFPTGQLLSGKIEVYYLIRPLSRKGGVRQHGQPEIFHKELDTHSSPVTLAIYSAEAATVEVWAKVEINGKPCFSGTFFTSYGRAEKTSQNPEPVAAILQWPALQMTGPRNYYAVQTGQPITLESINTAPENVTVYLDKAAVAVIRSHDGKFQYTPPHDKELSSKGYSAYKDLVFVANLPPDAGQLSFYLPLHRAYRGETDLKGGLWVLLASILLSLGWVLMKNRSFRWR